MGQSPCFGVCPQHVFETPDGSTGPTRHLLEHGLTDPGDSWKVQLPVEESLHGHLVRGVEDGRIQSSGPRRCLRERKTTEPFDVRRAELETRGPDQVEEFYTGRESLRPRERIGNWRTHVGRAELR